LLISEQTFEKQACIPRNTFLIEQRTYPLLDLTKRRRPQRKRLFKRRWPRPRSSNHGCPWIQKPAEKATVVLGSHVLLPKDQSLVRCQVQGARDTMIEVYPKWGRRTGRSTETVYRAHAQGVRDHAPRRLTARYLMTRRARVPKIILRTLSGYLQAKLTGNARSSSPHSAGRCWTFIVSGLHRSRCPCCCRRLIAQARSLEESPLDFFFCHFELHASL
jgi:hypothetical protein